MRENTKRNDDNFIYVSKKYKLAEGKNRSTDRGHKRKNKKMRKDKKSKPARNFTGIRVY